MKKVLSLLLAFVLMVSGVSLAVSAATLGEDDGTVNAGDIFPELTVYFDTATASKGHDVTVELKAANVDAFTQLSVTVNTPSGVTLKSAANARGTSVSLSGKVVTITADPAITDDGVVAKLTFNGTVVGEQTIVLSTTGSNGSTALTVNGASCILNVTAISQVPGDVDNDGVMDTTDLLLLKKLLAGLIDIDDPSIVYPNVDGDSEGKVDTADLVTLKKMLAGLL